MSEFAARSGHPRRQAQLRVARKFAAEPDPERVMHALLVEAQTLVGGSHGIVGRWREDVQALELVSTTLANWIPPRRIGRGRGLGTETAEKRAAVVVDDYIAYSRAVPELVRAGIRAAVAAPLLHEGRLLGVVTILSDQPGKRFTTEHIEILEMLGTIAAATLVGIERRGTMDRLRLETERLEQLTETIGDSVIVTDRDGMLLGWNRGAELLYGWSRHEVLGGPMVFVPPDLRSEANELWERVLSTGASISNYETERVTRAGRRVPILATIAPFRDEAGQIVGVIGIAKDLSARKELEEQAHSLARFTERESMAMDLHDHTMQALYGVVLSLGAIDRAMDVDPARARAQLRAANTQLQAIIRDFRSYLFDDRPRAFNCEPLRPGLVSLTNEVRANSQLTVYLEFDIDDTVEERIGETRAYELLRIAREATSNVLRHAQARTLAIRLGQEEGHVVLQLEDDGLGFDTDGPARHSGAGLTHMAERARRLGGSLSLSSAAGSGTVVRVRVPVA